MLIIGLMTRFFKTFLLLFALCPLVTEAAELPASVHAALRAAGIPPTGVGVVVQEIAAPRPAIAVNPATPMNPASVMKLVTTYAALEMLGPAYRWKTEAWIDGENLVLKGYGDPKLNLESFWMLLRNLRSRGLREIRGDVILDRSYFAPVAEARIDDDSFRPYNVGPDALLVNFKSLRFGFLPEGDRNRVRVYAEPALPGLELVNQLRLTDAAACPSGRAFRDLIHATFQSKPPRASFTGTYPLACGERDLNVALYEPEAYVGAMIRKLWGEMGGSWSGAVRNGTLPGDARLLYTHESGPLAEIVRDINKLSNNVMARQLYLTLAAETGGAPALGETARHAVRQWLDQKKIAAPGLVIDNGSGLSRVARASAATLAALLQAAWKSAVMPEFVSSLPLAATDGTMRKRLRGEAITGRAHIKTGLLQGVRSIAGYVLDRHGRRQVVVMIVNHTRAGEAQAAQDALLAWVYEGTRAPAPATSRRRGGAPRHP